MIPAARIEHLSPGRLRLRISDRRRQPDYFEALRARLGEEPAVQDVRVDPRTGSVLLLLDASSDAPALLRRTAATGLFAFPMASTPAVGAARPGMPAPLRALGRLTEPGSAASGPLALALLAGAAVQGWRGHWAAPAVTLTWYALQLLRSGRGSA